MTGEKSADLCTRLFKKFMKSQKWTKEEERLNLEFIESIENQSKNQKL